MKIKSLFAGFLALVMSASMMSVSAFAAESSDSSPEVQGKEIIVDSVEDLKWVSDYSNGVIEAVNNIPATFAGYTIKITKDIPNVGEWTPLVNFNGNMTGVLKEDNSTPVLSDIIVYVESNAGLCGNSANGKISNLTIANSKFETKVTGQNVGNYAGAFAANGFTSSFENCHVIDSTIKGNRFVGGITGYCYGNITGCTVKSVEGKTTISAALMRTYSLLTRNTGDNVGGIVGFMGEGNMKVTGCTVDGITVEGTRQVAGIAGLAEYGNTVSDNFVYNTTLHASLIRDYALYDVSASVGGVVGQIQPNSSNIITINNNTVSGLTVTRGGSSMNYCGWLLGDITRGTNYTASGNTYVGTLDLPEVYGAN